jgi:ribosomal protein S18 acetylase RimI-like enzyme
LNAILQDLSDPALPAAIEANLAEEMCIFGRGLPGAELHEDPQLLWFFTGKPHLNGILLSRFATADKAYADARIAQWIAYFKACHLSFGWSVGPSTRPADLATSLEAHGFTYEGQSSALAVAIETVHDDMPAPTGLIVKEVENEEMLKVKCSLEKIGFDASEETAQDYYDGYLASGFGKGTRWHHYIGWLNGEPVAMASLLLYAGVAGIYGVATVPAARRQGIGTALTLHALHEAHELGYRIATLTDTEMSRGIYRRMGFQQRCTVHHYAWSPNGE